MPQMPVCSGLCETHTLTQSLLQCRSLFDIYLKDAVYRKMENNHLNMPEATENKTKVNIITERVSLVTYSADKENINDLH